VLCSTVRKAANGRARLKPRRRNRRGMDIQLSACDGRARVQLNHSSREMWSSTFAECAVVRNVELARQAFTNRGSRRIQLHILLALKGFQPVESRGVSAPWCARLMGDRFHPANRLTLHLQVDLGVTVRRGRAGVSEILTDGGQGNAGLQQRNIGTVAHAVRMKALLAEMGKALASTVETPGQNVADAEPGQRPATSNNSLKRRTRSSKNAASPRTCQVREIEHPGAE
jgi:hypothetical protein